jgi:hypothetical protein
MNKTLQLLLALSTTLLAGCGATIFKADFDRWPSDWLVGPPPGSPIDDQIRVQDPGNPVLTGSSLLYYPPPDAAYFFSHPVADLNSTRTIFWFGRLYSGGVPSGPASTAAKFTVLLSGENAPGTPTLANALELRFSNDEVKVIDVPSGNAVLHSHALNPNTTHRVFISLRLKSGTYRMTIQQVGTPVIEFTGQLNPLTASWIKTHSRIVLAAHFFQASASDRYEIDGIVMRRKR